MRHRDYDRAEQWEDEQKYLDRPPCDCDEDCECAECS